MRRRSRLSIQNRRSSVGSINRTTTTCQNHSFNPQGGSAEKESFIRPPHDVSVNVHDDAPPPLSPGGPLSNHQEEPSSDSDGAQLITGPSPVKPGQRGGGDDMEDEKEQLRQAADIDMDDPPEPPAPAPAPATTNGGPLPDGPEDADGPDDADVEDEKAPLTNPAAPPSQDERGLDANDMDEKRAEAGEGETDLGPGEVPSGPPAPPAPAPPGDDNMEPDERSEPTGEPARKVLEEERRKVQEAMMQEEEPGVDAYNVDGIDGPLTKVYNKRRLMIKEMVLFNFKSYLGEKRIGPFHKRFTSIIGPNGSGKSNVIDALLFVFGRRASTMRFKKVVELIYAKTGQDIRRASVEIHFQEIEDDYTKDDDGFKIIEGTEFVISRTVKKKTDKKTGELKLDKKGRVMGDSWYQINNKRATGQEVADKLKPLGLDLSNNRFLILQGEVEKISLLPPKGKGPSEQGLLEYLEEIIGSDKFVEGIDDCKEKEKALEVEVTDAVNNLRAMEKDRDKLAKAKKEAVRYLELYHEKAVEEARLVEKDLAKCGKRKGELEAKLATLQDKKIKLEDEKKKSDDIIKGMKAEYDDSRKQHDELEEQFQSHQKTVDEKQRLHTALKEERRDLRDQKGKTKKEIEKLTKLIEDGRAEQKDCEEALPSLDKTIKNLRKRVEEMEIKRAKIMEELEEKVKPIRAEIQVKQEELIPLKDKENEFSTLVKKLQEKIKKREKKFKTAEKDLEKCKSKLDEAVNGKKDAEREFGLADAAAKGFEDRMKDLNQQIRDIKKRSEEFSKAITNKRTQIDFSMNQKRQQGGSRKMIQALLQAQEAGHLRGIIGRLGNLGTIDQRYDVAVSTAVSKGLEVCLVETATDATNAIRYLKQNKLGHLNFHSLEQLHNIRNNLLNGMQPIETPGNLPRLFDLVTKRPNARINEDNLKLAFYFYMKDTLVAKDIMEAKHYSLALNKRWTIVGAEKGAMVMSHSISGGGRSVKKGGMADKVIDDGMSEEKINSMQEELAKLVADSKDNGRKGKELHKELRTTNGELKEAKKARDRAQLNVEENSQDIKDQEAQLPKLQKAYESVKKKLENDDAPKNLAKGKKYLTQQQDRCKKVETEIKRLQQQCEDCGGAELRMMTEGLNDNKKKIEEANDEHATKSQRIKDLERKFKEWDTKIEKAQKELEEIKKNIAETKKNQEKAEVDAVKALEKQSKIREAREAMQKKWTTISQKYEKLQEEVNGIDRQLVTVRSKYKQKKVDAKILLKNMEGREKDLQAKVANIQNHEKDIIEAVMLDDVDNEAADDEDLEDKKEDLPDEKKDDNAMDVDDDQPKPAKKKKPRVASEKFKPYERMKPEDVIDLDVEMVKAKINEIDERIKKQAPNMGAINEWKKKEREVVSMGKRLAKVKKRRKDNNDELSAKVDERFKLFNKAFQQINRELKMMYRTLTIGGDAELNMVDRLDPFQEGVEFTVRPPKKSWKVISNLSGGEKTLSSMSLVFALHKFKPTPLYVMDEIDAALDYKNVSIVADYIKRETKNAQFIIISLRSNMFEQANWLTGIYKTHDASKSITLDPKECKKLAMQQI